MVVAEDRTAEVIEDVDTLHKAEAFRSNLVSKQTVEVPPTTNVQLVRFAGSMVILLTTVTGDLMNTLLTMNLLPKLMC